jgi:peptide/nickel transport system substrate-binding protein
MVSPTIIEIRGSHAAAPPVCRGHHRRRGVRRRGRLERVPAVPNGPSSFTAFTKQIKEMIIVDPLTIRFRTATQYPLMPPDMTQVTIISKAAAKATTDDFNSGKAAIGTGPYRLVRCAKGERIELARNDAWWGGKTPWTKVTLRLLPQDASRVAALLSGDVQVIENVPTTDVARLKRDKRLAINRTAIVEKVMEGEAVPSGQLVADFLFGATKNLKVEAFDPEDAKQLLAEAGWPDGFGLTIHAPNNRYVNDAEIAQAVAQMPARVGIGTKVVAMPSSTFFSQATQLKFSFMLVGWSTGTGEASSSLKALLMTFNPDRGFGNANRGRYSNGKVDALTEDALATVDDAKREAMLQRATELAINDTGIIPLHFRSTCGRRAAGSPTCRAPTSTRWRGGSSPGRRSPLRSRSPPITANPACRIER